MWSSGDSGQSNTPVWPNAGGGAPWSGGGASDHPAWAPQGPSGWGGPSPSPAPAPGPAPGPAPQRSMTVPYRLNLRNGVYDGLLIAIKGVIKPNANKITVDICTKGDIAFHLNPRFNEGGKQVIVRNSCQSKKWGKEERDLPQFPFVRGQQFEMEILCTSSEFKVSVNRSPLLTFKHRVTDLRSISTLNIHHDLDLISVDQRSQ